MRNITLTIAALLAVVAFTAPVAHVQLIIEHIITCRPETITRTRTTTRQVAAPAASIFPPGHRDPSQQSHAPVVVSGSLAKPEPKPRPKSSTPQYIDPLTYTPVLTHATNIQAPRPKVTANSEATPKYVDPLTFKPAATHKSKILAGSKALPLPAPNKTTSKSYGTIVPL